MKRGEMVRDDREALALVRACPDRGSVLPHSRQPEGCARRRELTECRRLGRGVTPAECVRCVCNQAEAEKGTDGHDL